jgi:hypothetical protein
MSRLWGRQRRTHAAARHAQHQVRTLPVPALSRKCLAAGPYCSEPLVGFCPVRIKRTQPRCLSGVVQFPNSPP